MTKNSGISLDSLLARSNGFIFGLLVTLAFLDQFYLDSSFIGKTLEAISNTLTRGANIGNFWYIFGLLVLPVITLIFLIRHWPRDAKSARFFWLGFGYVLVPLVAIEIFRQVFQVYPIW